MSDSKKTQSQVEESTTLPANRTTRDSETAEKEVEKMKVHLVLSLCMIQFLSFSAFSLMTPFYPIKAKEKGIEIIWIGQVIGIMAFM